MQASLYDLFDLAAANLRECDVERRTIIEFGMRIHQKPRCRSAILEHRQC